MKKFLIQITLFALVIAATLAAGELIVRSVPNPYRLKHERMTAEGKNLRTLVLGNSHAFYGIRPDLLPGPAFNLANVSQPLRYDLELLRHYAPMLGDSLEFIILPISYTSLFDPELEDGDEWWRAINYKIYMDLDRHSDFSVYNLELSHISVFNRKLAVSAGLEKSDMQTRDDGFGMAYILENKYDGWETTGPQTAERHLRGMVPENVGRNTAVLDSIAAFADSRGASLIMAVMPAWHTYTDNLDPARLAQMRDSLKAVSLRHDNIVYADFLTDSRFGADDFYDADHLTSDLGATRFTHLLDSLITTRL